MSPGQDLTPGLRISTWDEHAAVPELAGDDVHVWLLDLAAGDDSARALLSEEELARADAFRFEIHSRRYANGRAGLRQILGAYAGLDPAALELVEGPNGKPELAEPTRSGIRFNLAHSEGCGLCAVSRVEVGVDVELVDRPRRPEWRELAARFFHPEEARTLVAMSGDAGWVEFLRVWTLKEACLKALGFGLVADTRSFSVADIVAGRGDRARLAGRDLRCEELSPGAGLVAALAFETPSAAAASPGSASFRAPRSRS